VREKAGPLLKSAGVCNCGGYNIMPKTKKAFLYNTTLNSITQESYVEKNFFLLIEFSPVSFRQPLQEKNSP
jgi:hypothetical protein